MLKKFRIKLNDKEYIVEMEDLNPEVQFQAASGQESTAANAPVESTSIPQDTPPPDEDEPAAPGAGEEATAPMPGTILDVHVQEGDSVTEEQAIVTLEAMKMENKIVSPIDGTVTSLLVQKGQAVDVGDVLFTVD